MYVLKDFKIGKNSGCMLFEIQNFIFFLGGLCAFCNITRGLISAGYLISTQKTY